MTKAKQMTCKRCNGSGYYMSDERVCYSCNGKGELVADKFFRSVGVSGLFFGVTGPVCDMGVNKGTVCKEVMRASSAAELMKNLEAGSSVAEINEEQARAFFKRYGTSTRKAA